MRCYKVRFDDYCLVHHDEFTYLNYFEFAEYKYPIGTHVQLTENGERYMFSGYGYGFLRGNFRLVDHFIDDKGVEKWKYIIGRSYEGDLPYFHTTTKKPDELINKVLCTKMNETNFTPGELEVKFKEQNYPAKDTEVDGVMSGWVILVLVWIGAFIFKDWWLRLIIQICAGIYFGNWRENKISESISTQKVKE